MYLRIPKHNEEAGLRILGGFRGLIYVEEKVDGKLLDGETYAAVELGPHEVFFFGELIAGLDATHVLIYRSPPARKLIFDVAWRERGTLKYLEPCVAATLTLYLGHLFVPMMDVAEGGPWDKYHQVQSRLNSELNPKFCAEKPTTCENFYQKYGKKPTEGFIVKRYEAGRLVAVKFVKDEFEELIQLMGRTGKYLVENKYVSPLTLDEFEKYWLTIFNILKKANCKTPPIADAYETYLRNFDKVISQEAMKDAPSDTRDLIRKILEDAIQQ